jgi:hypothetical protein
MVNLILFDVIIGQVYPTSGLGVVAEMWMGNLKDNNRG